MSRWTALASVAALFLSGVAIGALGMHLLDKRLAPPLPFGHPPHQRAALEDLQRQLRLTLEPREKVAAILEESWREGEEIRRDVQPRLDRHIAGTERRLREVLTPEQRETSTRSIASTGCGRSGSSSYGQARTARRGLTPGPGGRLPDPRPTRRRLRLEAGRIAPAHSIG